jgi:hypothetical protein
LRVPCFFSFKFSSDSYLCVFYFIWKRATFPAYLIIVTLGDKHNVRSSSSTAPCSLSLRYMALNSNIFMQVLVMNLWSSCMYKVVQIWPGLIVCKQVTVRPCHIWTTLYLRFVLFLWVTVSTNVSVSVLAGPELNVVCYEAR